MTDFANFPSPVAEALELALGRLDVRNAHTLLEGFEGTGLAGPRRENLARKLLAAIQLVSGNSRALAILGVAREALPVPLSGIWPFVQAEQLRLALIATRKQGGSFRTGLRLQAVDGRAIHVTFVAWREKEDEDTLSFGLLDITEQIAAQDELLRLHAQMAHADRLSTLGVMTATIAHEVRQPLAAMMTSAQAGLRWLRRHPADLAQVESCLETIALGATKANDTVAKLRTMASNRDHDLERCDVGVIIEETAAFLRQEIASRQASLLLDIAPGLPPVAADRVQLRQVLTNLMVNAAQTMADAQCWSRTLKVRARSDDGFVIVDVEDSGPGVTERDRDRLFEGFFTTKETGMGLGLRVCRAIIVGHGGTLEHLSKASAGSIFRFTLPYGAQDTASADEI